MYSRERHPGPPRWSEGSLGYAGAGLNATGAGTLDLMKLNERGYAHAQELIEDGHAVLDERDDWSEHQPSTATENQFIEEHGISEYGKWHLGIDEEKDKETKGRYKFPYGDFVNVHRCAVLAAESRAAQYDYIEIENASAHLHGMLETLKQGAARR